MTAIVPAWTGSDTTRSTCSVIEPTMFSAMIGMPTARSSSAAALMSPPMIEPARTSSRARGQVGDGPHRRGDFRLADERRSCRREIRSPRRLWRSASLTAPSATWATWAPPPTTMIRLPKIVPSSRVSCTSTTGSTPRRRVQRAILGQPFDLELDLGERRRSRRAAHDAQGPDAAAGVRDARGDGRDGARLVGELDADRGDRLGLAAGHSVRPRFADQPRTPRPAAPGRRSPTEIESGSVPAVGSCSSKARLKRRERVACGVRVRRREHQRPIRVLGHADDPGDVHAPLREGGRDAREGAGTIVETDREPDGQWAPPARGWYRGRRGLTSAARAAHRRMTRQLSTLVDGPGQSAPGDPAPQDPFRWTAPEHHESNRRRRPT